jgi:hypothetical protein
MVTYEMSIFQQKGATNPPSLVDGAKETPSMDPSDIQLPRWTANGNFFYFTPAT